MHCGSDSAGSCIDLMSGICSPYIAEDSAECLRGFIDCIEWQATLAPAETSTITTTPATTVAELAADLPDCSLCSSDVEYVCGQSGQQYDNFCFATCVGDYPWTIGPCTTNHSTGGGLLSMSNNQTKLGSENEAGSAVHAVMWTALALLPVALIAMAVINGKITKERATLKSTHGVHWQHTVSDDTAGSGSVFTQLDELGDGFNLEDNPFSSKELQWDVTYSPEAPMKVTVPHDGGLSNQTGSPLAAQRMSWAMHFSPEPTLDQSFGSPLANLAQKVDNADPQIFSHVPKSSLGYISPNALRQKADSARMVDESLMYTQGDPQFEAGDEVPMYALAKPKAPRLSQKLPTYLEPDSPGYALATHLKGANYAMTDPSGANLQPETYAMASPPTASADYAMATPPVNIEKPRGNYAVAASPATAATEYGRGRLASPREGGDENNLEHPSWSAQQASEPEYESEPGVSDGDEREPIYARASTCGSTIVDGMSEVDEDHEGNYSSIVDQTL